MTLTEEYLKGNTNTKIFYNFKNEDNFLITLFIL